MSCLVGKQEGWLGHWVGGHGCLAQGSRARKGQRSLMMDGRVGNRPSFSYFFLLLLHGHRAIAPLHIFCHSEYDTLSHILYLSLRLINISLLSSHPAFFAYTPRLVRLRDLFAETASLGGRFSRVSALARGLIMSTLRSVWIGALPVALYTLYILARSVEKTQVS